MPRNKLPRATGGASGKPNQQFAVLPAALVLDRETTPAQKAVAMVICLHANRDGWAWPSLDTMAEMLGVQKPQISKMVQALRARGHVEMHYRVLNGKRKLYFRVIYDRPVETLVEAEREASPAEALVSTTETSDDAGKAPGGDALVSMKETSADAVSFHGGNDLFPSRKRNVSMVETPFFEHSSEHTKEQELPTPPAREAVGLEAQFADPQHREAYLALRAQHRNPPLLDIALRTVHQPPTGGPAFAWATIGAGLVDQLGNGETFNLNRLRGYCRSQLTAGVAPAVRSDAKGPHRASGAVSNGDRPWSGAALWDLFVRGGLTAPMQSRDALAERVEALVRDGAVSDGRVFLALVVHVKPWALAEIKFAKTREDRLLELLASFRVPSQGAA